MITRELWETVAYSFDAGRYLEERFFHAAKALELSICSSLKGFLVLDISKINVALADKFNEVEVKYILRKLCTGRQYPACSRGIDLMSIQHMSAPFVSLSWWILMGNVK